MDSLNPYAAPAAQLGLPLQPDETVASATIDKLLARRWVFLALLAFDVIFAVISVFVAEWKLRHLNQPHRVVVSTWLVPAAIFAVWQAAVFWRAWQCLDVLRRTPTFFAVAKAFRAVRFVWIAMAAGWIYSDLGMKAMLYSVTHSAASVALSPPGIANCSDEVRRLRDTIRFIAALVVLRCIWGASLSFAERASVTPAVVAIIAQAFLLFTPALIVWSYARRLDHFLERPSADTLDRAAAGQRRMISCVAVVTALGLALLGIGFSLLSRDAFIKAFGGH